VEAVAQHPRERLLFAPLELDERLRLVVSPERRRLPGIGRPEPVTRGNRTRSVERVRAVHRDVERHDGEGLREVADADEHGPRREHYEGDPEDRSSHGRDSIASVPARYADETPARSATSRSSLAGSTGFVTWRSYPDARARTRSSSRA